MKNRIQKNEIWNRNDTWVEIGRINHVGLLILFLFPNDN